MPLSSALLGYTAGVLALMLAVGTLVTSPRRTANRLLALGLFVEAIAQAGDVSGRTLPPPWPALLRLATPFAVGALPFVYLMLLSVLDSPLVRWLRPRRAQIALGVLAVIGGVVPTVGLRVGASTQAPWVIPMVLTSYLLIVLVLLFALAAAISAIEHAPDGSAAQRKARAFLLSFGVRDAFAIAGLAVVIFGASQGGAVLGTRAPLVALGENLARLGTILAMPMLAYGILRNQLFDIDLRLRWGISRGTVVAAFVVVFLIASKIAEFYLSRSAGWVAGGIAAGLLLFVTPRLNRLADQVADAAVPGVSATPAYVAFRKLEVYKAAVESALETGPIDARERQMLDRLQAKLGLSAADCAALEAEVLGPATEPVFQHATA